MRSQRHGCGTHTLMQPVYRPCAARTSSRAASAAARAARASSRSSRAAARSCSASSRSRSASCAAQAGVVSMCGWMGGQAAAGRRLGSALLSAPPTQAGTAAPARPCGFPPRSPALAWRPALPVPAPWPPPPWPPCTAASATARQTASDREAAEAFSRQQQFQLPTQTPCRSCCRAPRRHQRRLQLSNAPVLLLFGSRLRLDRNLQRAGCRLDLS